MPGDATDFDAKVKALEDRAHAVACIEDVLRRAKRGEVLSFVIVAEIGGDIGVTTSRTERHHLVGLADVGRHLLLTGK